ncbi:hypothetical protein DXG03_002946 [Asterophora parasitica]|uniref:Uncharacterized protein n=1 Tax=Asterophora parasitica TaxID=117018 RepID=A0A9P7K8G5_9AGAR|nr:hypothetical protein DXG03_002946 [Asterophora parasitica]
MQNISKNLHSIHLSRSDSDELQKRTIVLPTLSPFSLAPKTPPNSPTLQYDSNLQLKSKLLEELSPLYSTLLTLPLPSSPAHSGPLPSGLFAPSAAGSGLTELYFEGDFQAILLAMPMPQPAPTRLRPRFLNYNEGPPEAYFGDDEDGISDVAGGYCDVMQDCFEWIDGIDFLRLFGLEDGQSVFYNDSEVLQGRCARGNIIGRPIESLTPLDNLQCYTFVDCNDEAQRLSAESHSSDLESNDEEDDSHDDLYNSHLPSRISSSDVLLPRDKSKFVIGSDSDSSDDDSNFDEDAINKKFVIGSNSEGTESDEECDSDVDHNYGGDIEDESIFDDVLHDLVAKYNVDVASP